LAAFLENGFKGKELMNNMCEIGTRSFSHWQAATLSVIKSSFSQYLSIGYKTCFHRFNHNSLQSMEWLCANQETLMEKQFLEVNVKRQHQIKLLSLHGN